MIALRSSLALCKQFGFWHTPPVPACLLCSPTVQPTRANERYRFLPGVPACPPSARAALLSVLQDGLPRRGARVQHLRPRGSWCGRLQDRPAELAARTTASSCPCDQPTTTPAASISAAFEAASHCSGRHHIEVTGLPSRGRESWEGPPGIPEELITSTRLQRNVPRWQHIRLGNLRSRLRHQRGGQEC